MISRREYLSLMSAAAAAAATGDTDRDRRMKWWHDAKFGMFIHWGLYSVLGRHEWVMEQEAIPVSEYNLLANRFTPKPNAARDWARLAKRAGQKYMVMTTKHHEGFCLFNSQHTDYCAPKQACGRDLVKEFVEAARAEGLRRAQALRRIHSRPSSRAVQQLRQTRRPLVRRRLAAGRPRLAVGRDEPHGPAVAAGCYY